MRLLLTLPQWRDDLLLRQRLLLAPRAMLNGLLQLLQ